MLWAELLTCLINSNEQNKTMLFKAYEIIGVFEKNINNFDLLLLLTKLFLSLSLSLLINNNMLCD